MYGKGDRYVVRHVQFKKRFAVPPQVTTAITTLDIQHDRNTRLTVYPQNINQYGFDLVFKTWADTIVYEARAAWTAVGY